MFELKKKEIKRLSLPVALAELGKRQDTLQQRLRGLKIQLSELPSKSGSLPIYHPCRIRLWDSKRRLNRTISRIVIECNSLSHIRNLAADGFWTQAMEELRLLIDDVGMSSTRNRSFTGYMIWGDPELADLEAVIDLYERIYSALERAHTLDVVDALLDRDRQASLN